MAMNKGLPKGAGFNQKPMNKTQARRSLTIADKKALPFLNKKYNNTNSPEFGMWQEDRLVKLILERLRLSDVERRNRVQRCQEIDVQLSGIVKMEHEDKKRDHRNKRGEKPQPVEMNLPLTYAQVDDAVTYMMSLFAPEMNIFEAAAAADKQPIAEGVTQEVNKQGQALKYYREFAKFCLNAIKYNFGGMTVYWEEQNGTVFAPSTAKNSAMPGQLVKTNGLLWQGNVLKSIDAYNFFFDTSVHPVDLPLRGEYFAIVEPYTPFRVRRMNQQNILFGIERFIDSIAPIANTDSGTFYISPPRVREPSSASAAGGVTNWQMILAPGGPAKESQPSIELVWYTTWIIPADYDLSDSTEMEVWRICMAQGKYICAAVHVEDTHGQLPVGCASPIEDDLRNDQRTFTEQLLPLQHFGSFLLNTHVAATRKAIYGTTVYDKNLFPGLDLDTTDLIGARIPMKSSATGIDIDKAFRHYNAAPQTDANVDMVAKIVELMQKILPTNQAQQVADLERATEYQAAATVQASSRRNLKIARLINDQAVSTIKFQMLYNMYSKLTVIEYTDNTTGQKQQITPQQILEANIEFDIGTGLKGLDRLMQISIFKDIMSYLFQMKDIAQQVDVLGLLSYVAQLAGFRTDLSQFKIQQPAPVTPPAEAQPAGQTPASQSGGNVVPLPQQQGQ